MTETQDDDMEDRKNYPKRLKMTIEKPTVASFNPKRRRSSPKSSPTGPAPARLPKPKPGDQYAQSPALLAPLTIQIYKDLRRTPMPSMGLLAAPRMTMQGLDALFAKKKSIAEPFVPPPPPVHADDGDDDDDDSSDDEDDDEEENKKSLAVFDMDDDDDEQMQKAAEVISADVKWLQSNQAEVAKIQRTLETAAVDPQHSPFIRGNALGNDPTLSSHHLPMTVFDFPQEPTVSLDDMDSIFNTYKANTIEALSLSFPLAPNLYQHCMHGDQDIQHQEFANNNNNNNNNNSNNKETGGEGATERKRPAGSCKKNYPKPYDGCFCKCAEMVSLTGKDIRIGVPRLIDCGLIKDGETVCMHLPSTDMSEPLAVIGKIFLRPATINVDRHVEYYDIGSSKSYCCPAAWMLMLFADLAIQGKINDSAEMAKKVTAQVKLDRNCMQFVSIFRLNGITLQDLFVVYRHAIGQHAAAQRAEHGGEAQPRAVPTVGRQASIPAPNYMNFSDVRFPTAADLIQIFAQTKDRITWPEDEGWRKAMTKQLRSQDAYIKMLKDELYRLTPAAPK